VRLHVYVSCGGFSKLSVSLVPSDPAAAPSMQ